jgi:hypothetical protein
MEFPVTAGDSHSGLQNGLMQAGPAALSVPGTSAGTGPPTSLTGAEIDVLIRFSINEVVEVNEVPEQEN